MQPFIDSKLLQRLRVGPLASYLDVYLEHIEREGFLPSSVPMQMYAIARFSGWLHCHQLDVADVSEVAVERFLKRDSDVLHSSEPAVLRRLLKLLRQMGLIKVKESKPLNCLRRFVHDYSHYLRLERGLAETSIANYAPFVEQFLSARFGSKHLNLAELNG